MTKSSRGQFRTSCRTAALVACTFAVMAPVAASRSLAAEPVEVAGFGSNPGNLTMFKYIPDALPASAPLVVVMHGCKQNARSFANESGWIQLADTLRLALALPEQTQGNNQNRCFNWFQPGDITRDQGEALSVKQMVDKIKAEHDIDPKRIYVTGLSAGGAMTAVMLATYPDVFAGGAIMAGLAYGCAKNLADALQCMSTGYPVGGATVGLPVGLPNTASIGVPLPPGFCLFFPLLCPQSGDRTFTPAQLGDMVRHASSHSGPFPKVSIWHGTADTVVSPVNATELVQQWTNVHSISPEPTARDTVKGFPRHVFKDASGNAVVELYLITSMAHGGPVDPGAGPDQCGVSAAFVLDMNICSSFFIARFWGLQ
jgi:poly(hydroxyalkanoate) depolymerase family esterase